MWKKSEISTVVMESLEGFLINHRLTASPLSGYLDLLLKKLARRRFRKLLVFP